MNIPLETLFNADGPQPLVRPIPSGEAFPVHALGPLRAVVEAVQGITQAPMALPAGSALAVASLAVQAFANVQTLGGDRALSLYVLTIARSGERKSACDAPLMEALREYERDQSRNRNDALNVWSNSQALWKGRRDKILSEAKKSTGKDRLTAEADLSALGPEPNAPPLVERTVTEPTFEGLTRLYAEGLPSLGIFSDEGGQFLGGHAMQMENRQKTLAALNDLWQGNPIRRTRHGDGAYTLYGRRLAMHLMVQPTVARAFMSDPLAADTGFLPRFLMSEPPSAIGTRMQRNARSDQTSIFAFSSRLKAVLETQMPMEPVTRELTPLTVTLSPEARDLLVCFADTVEDGQAAGGKFEAITGTASKAAEQAARIAGVFTMWRDLDAAEVAGDDMANAITLAQYYLSEAVRLSSAATLSAEIDQAEKLRKWLFEKWSKKIVTVRDVVRLGPNALRESPKARKALNILQQHDWIIRLEEGALVDGIARKEAWQLVFGGEYAI